MEWIIGIFVVVVGLVIAAVVIDHKRKELDAEEEAEAGDDVAGLEEESVYVSPQGRDIEEWEESRHGRYSGKSTWKSEPDEDLEDEIRSSPSHHIREAQRAYRRRQGIGEDESGWIAESNYAAASASLADYDGDGVPDALEPDPFVYVPDEGQLTQVDLHPVDESRDDYPQQDAGLSVLDSGGMFEEPDRAPDPAPSYDPPPSYTPDPTPSYDPPSSSSYDSGSSGYDSGSSSTDSSSW
jgi:hypothetical protein